MVKRSRFSDYKDSYAHYQFELSPEGVLFMQCSTNGGPFEWMWESHDSMADAFADIAGDREIKCVIHTGTGDTYNALWGKPVTADQKPLYNAYGDAEGIATMDEKGWYGRKLLDKDHQSLGYGEHSCPGALLARTDSIIIYERLLARFPDWELASAPVRWANPFIQGMASLPLKFSS